MTPLSPIASSRLQELARRLLKHAGFSGEDFVLHPLPGGRNNRVFRLEGTDGEFLLKQYFHSPEDPRDRLGHEYRLLEYLSGSPYAARPYASDPENYVALMEFIHGAPIGIVDVGIPHIDQAVGFFQDLNLRRLSAAGYALPPASEACFSLSEHIAATQQRIHRLENISPKLPVDIQAQQFVQDSLLPLWHAVRKRIESSLPSNAQNEILPRSECCLSPSDFGFHNALQQTDGSIRFVDFEYAGWDDPAKLIADFANQPDMTLDQQLSNRFKSAILKTYADPEKLRLRVDLLEPLYQVKWTCICLNDFLTVGKSRRNFVGVNGNAPEIATKLFQLKRAEKMLDRAR